MFCLFFFFCLLCIYISLSVCPSVDLSVRPSVLLARPYVRPSVHQSVRPSLPSLHSSQSNSPFSDDWPFPFRQQAPSLVCQSAIPISRTLRSDDKLQRRLCFPVFLFPQAPFLSSPPLLIGVVSLGSFHHPGLCNASRQSLYIPVIRDSTSNVEGRKAKRS